MIDSNDKYLNRVKSSFNKQSFCTLIGAELEYVEHGKVIISCKYNDNLTQQHGFIHAGVVTTIADVSCGYAALTTMPEENDVLTVEFKINLMKPANTKKIVATGEVIKAGKNLVIVESTVKDENGENIIAKMLATMFPIIKKK